MSSNETLKMTVMEHTRIQLQTEEDAKENERSPSVAILCAGLLIRRMLYELERVCNGFMCSMSATNDGAVLLWQRYHKQAICMCFLL